MMMIRLHSIFAQPTVCTRSGLRLYETEKVKEIYSCLFLLSYGINTLFFFLDWKYEYCFLFFFGSFFLPFYFTHVFMKNNYPNCQHLRFSFYLCLCVKKPYNGARPARNNAPVRNSRPASSTSRTSNNSLVVANLHFNVTEKDLYDLFGQIGTLKRAFLHIGPNGKSAGIADVVFQSSQDAERARNTYNNVELDGNYDLLKNEQHSSNS
ncbi:unnamed protein product [Mucor circinelloides]